MRGADRWYGRRMDLGRLVTRSVIGPLFIGHGTQKLFGWFGGHGPAGTGAFFESLGMRPGRGHALAAGAAEARRAAEGGGEAGGGRAAVGEGDAGAGRDARRRGGGSARGRAG